jgi:heme/copper-type cytochrome/quinol oxidase subunit 2
VEVRRSSRPDGLGQPRDGVCRRLDARLWRGAALFVLVFGFGCEKLPPLPDLLRIRVVGESYEWLVRYPGPDAVLDTEDDVHAKQNLRLPERTRVEIEVRSTDYIYAFRIPAFGVNQMAVPDLVSAAEFVTPETSVHPLRGDQLCGYAHKSLRGFVIIEPKRDFQRWQVKRGIDS